MNYCRCGDGNEEKIFKLEITREGLDDLARLLHSAGYPVRLSFYGGDKALISGWRASVPPPPPPPEPTRRIRRTR